MKLSKFRPPRWLEMLSRSVSPHLFKGGMLIFAVALKTFSQLQPIIPLAPLPNDREQIQWTIENFARAFTRKDINAVSGMMTSLPNVATRKPIESIADQQIVSLEPGAMRLAERAATVHCRFLNCFGAEVFESEVSLEKVGSDWFLKETPELIDAIQSIVGASDLRPKALNSSGPGGLGRHESLTAATVRLIPEMYAPIPHPLTPTTDDPRCFVLNWAYTITKINRQLFGSGARLSLGGIFRGGDEAQAVAFAVDPSWNRIIFGQGGNNGWLKSFGDHQNELGLAHPGGMSIDLHDTIYIADSDNGRIVKIWYDFNNHAMGWWTTLNVPGLIHPVDLAIDQVGYFSNPSDPTAPANDHIWIADDFGGRLVDIRRNGSIVQTITNYVVPGGAGYLLRHPSKVQTQENNRIALIDRDRNAFVLALPPATGSTTAQALNSTEFDATTSSLSSIGQDANGEWLVADTKMGMYHHFTEDGQYIGSINGVTGSTSAFSSPVTAAKSPWAQIGASPARSLYVYTGDKWGPATGLRAFLPGSNAVDLSVTDDGYTGSCNLNVNFLLTNKSHVTAEYINSDTGYPYGTFFSGVLKAGRQTLQFSKYLLEGSKQYKVRLTVTPYYYDLYPMPGLSHSATTLSFSRPDYSMSPGSFSANITPGSQGNCFQSYGSPSWTANPSCPGGRYRYEWHRCLSNCAAGNWGDVVGTGQTYSFNYWGGYSDYGLNTYFTLKCTVTNDVPGGPSYDTYFQNCAPPPPPSCPFVYTWDGSQFREDNNILPQSEYPENAGIDVTDYYRLLKPLQASNGSYILHIREFERERSSFDQFRLLAVDHPPSTKVDVAPSTGDIYEYITPYGLRRARLRGDDITGKLSAMDSNSVTVNAGDTLRISIDVPIKQNASTIMQTSGGGEGGGDGVPKVYKIAYATTVSSLNSSEEGTFSFRQRPTLVFTPMTLDSANSVNLVWTRKARLDYFNYGVTVPSHSKPKELSLTSARHSVAGDVTMKLGSSDSVYASLNPGEYIELKFDAIAPPPGNLKRTFILVSRGKYSRISDSTISYPKAGNVTEIVEYKLNPTYPNPFNPVTHIAYQMPADAHTTVAIYDMVGREVTRLVDGWLAKGSYSAEWNAGDAASGVYICRFLVTSEYGRILYSDTKKLVVIK